MKSTKANASWTTTTLGRDRRRLLIDRIEDISRAKWRDNKTEERKAEPPKVVAARKIVDAHEAKLSAIHEARRDAVGKACAFAKSVVLFAETAIDAKRAVDRLEATARKAGWIAA